MMKYFISVITFFLALACYSYSQEYIYVSAVGNDNYPGTKEQPVQTIFGAYQKIVFPGEKEYKILVNANAGPVLVSPNTNYFNWEKSGTKPCPITITSEKERAVITRKKDGGANMIRILNSDYIVIKNLRFENATLGAVLLSNTKNCDVTNCIFSGGLAYPDGGGCIWIGSDKPGQYSMNNKIRNNLFYNLKATKVTDQLHGIYISHWNQNNVFERNFIVNAPAYAIHFWHGNNNRNVVCNNVLLQNLSDSCKMPSIILASPMPDSTTGNMIVDNYTYDLKNDIPVYLGSRMNDLNVVSENNLVKEYYVNDPYWLNPGYHFYPEKLICGDFDNDNNIDDIALVHYDTITLWESTGREHSFFYNKKKTVHSFYNANYTYLSGDFDGDKYRDDIIAVHTRDEKPVFEILQNIKDSFVYKSVNSDVFSEKINHLIDIKVGDFNDDNLNNDLVVALTTTKCEFRVMLLNINFSNETNDFGMQLIKEWYVDSAQLSEDNLSLLTGHFNKKNKQDDILIVSGKKGIGVTLKGLYLNGNEFKVPEILWQTNSFTDVNVKNSFVSGATQKKKTDGVYAMVKISNFVYLMQFMFEKDKFGLLRNDSWSYDDNDNFELSGNIVSGRFSNSNKTNEIVAFANYTKNNGNYRTLVWSFGRNNIIMLNNLLGFPWLTKRLCFY